MASPEARSAALLAGLREIAPDYVFHLPSSTLKGILDGLDELGITVHPLTREEEGIGIASGLAWPGANRSWSFRTTDSAMR